MALVIPAYTYTSETHNLDEKHRKVTPEHSCLSEYGRSAKELAKSTNASELKRGVRRVGKFQSMVRVFFFSFDFSNAD